MAAEHEALISAAKIHAISKQHPATLLSASTLCEEFETCQVGSLQRLSRVHIAPSCPKKHLNVSIILLNNFAQFKKYIQQLRRLPVGLKALKPQSCRMQLRGCGATWPQMKLHRRSGASEEHLSTWGPLLTSLSLD